MDESAEVHLSIATKEPYLNENEGHSNFHKPQNNAETNNNTDFRMIYGER